MRYECSKQEVVVGSARWKFKSFAYLAKRGELLYINIIVQDLNSVHEHFGHDFINSRCVINKDGLYIQESFLNNATQVKLADSLVDLKSNIAREIYELYYKVK